MSDLRIVFRTRGTTIHAVNGISFELQPGELLGVVDESGSGKSVTMMSLMKLLPSPPAEIVSGRVRLGCRDLLSLDPSEMRKVRGGEVGFIFQDLMTSLNLVGIPSPQDRIRLSAPRLHAELGQGTPVVIDDPAPGGGVSIQRRRRGAYQPAPWR
ncbi:MULTISPECIES: ATP-binding cassette domain-containing protein [Mesorhizobium]|uniref:ATP-binding cassette domain-containing protein n=1 Tax=unclassified Mesorhizobium TaxID=325217 RepID=UPI001F11E546|nr:MULTISPECIES: ATP-binding cassette domain-containing protein [Mesorhizobium]